MASIAQQIQTVSGAAPLPTPAPTPKPVIMGTGMMYSAPPASATQPPPPPPPPPVSATAPVETVQGRIGQLLTTDQKGNYTNPVVRQAVDRQNQTFNARGMLNSSMAAQAGQEAAISKASDIAAVDAQSINTANQQARDQQFQQNTRLDEQDFALRKDYQGAVQSVSTNFQKMVDTINASQMTPADKSVAIAQAQSVRDGELAYQNNLYANMPRWKSEWLAMAVPSSGLDVGSINNADTLANIANDPAQPQSVRDAARARIPALQAAVAAPPPSPPSYYNPYPYYGGGDGDGSGN